MFKNILEKFSTPPRKLPKIFVPKGSRIALNRPIKNASNDLESCNKELIKSNKNRKYYKNMYKSEYKDSESCNKELKKSNKGKKIYKELYENKNKDYKKTKRINFLLIFTIFALLSFGINFENKKKIFNIIELITIFIIPLVGSFVSLVEIIDSSIDYIKKINKNRKEDIKLSMEDDKSQMAFYMKSLPFVIIILILSSLVFYTGLVNNNVISNKLLSDKIFKLSNNAIKITKIGYFSLISALVISILPYDLGLFDSTNITFDYFSILLFVILLYTNLVDKNIINNKINNEIFKVFTNLLFIVKKTLTPVVLSYFIEISFF
tara:strand:- start:696 stop:1658 length:963 start_codon:yes stop_codon:yes gene_type:complete